MIICLKGISEERFLFSENVNTNLNFKPKLWALGRLSEGTWALDGHVGT